MEQQDLNSPGSLTAFYKQVIDHYGHDSQSDAIIEEAAELIHAICKHRQQARKNGDTSKTREQVLDEIVDMQIALDQARLMFFGDAEDHYLEIRKRKLAKLAEQAGIRLI